jgi:FkbM family methyltransferase
MAVLRIHFGDRTLTTANHPPIHRKTRRLQRPYDLCPRWARLSLAYERSFPNHPGKRTILHALYRFAGRSGRPFVWRMKNGALLAVSPAEGLAPYATVGWTCFQRGVWEAHVERILREVLRPGDTGYDIGANLGYFSAVMAQAVGSSGRVVAFEPVPGTFARLALCQELNGYSQLTPLQTAVGATSGSIELALDPRLPGEASTYPRLHRVEPLRVRVPICKLDELVQTHELPPPSLIKIDVEGHELAVLEGATRILDKHRPALVFELNVAMSRQAGWSASELAALLGAVAPYRFFLLGKGKPRPIELKTLALDEDAYVDILALA